MVCDIGDPASVYWVMLISCLWMHVCGSVFVSVCVCVCCVCVCVCVCSVCKPEYIRDMTDTDLLTAGVCVLWDFYCYEDQMGSP